jgi:hypothetical protein
MSRVDVTYPPEMLPRASDPETAEVIVCEPSLNDGRAQAGASPRSSAVKALVGSFCVVEVKIRTDTGSCLSYAGIGFEIDLFVFD